MMGFLVTGAPGVGKSTLLEALGALGFITMGDTARQLIQERKSLGLPPRPSAPEFAAALFRRDCTQYDSARQLPETVFFERGVPDSLCMLDDTGSLTDSELKVQLARFPYNDTAFILPPWENIFVADDERDQTFTDALRIHDKLVHWYARCGFGLVEVPRSKVARRCEFVLDRVQSVRDA